MGGEGGGGVDTGGWTLLPTRGRNVWALEEAGEEVTPPLGTLHVSQQLAAALLLLLFSRGLGA